MRRATTGSPKKQRQLDEKKQGQLDKKKKKKDKDFEDVFFKNGHLDPQSLLAEIHNPDKHSFQINPFFARPAKY